MLGWLSLAHGKVLAGMFGHTEQEEHQEWPFYELNFDLIKVWKFSWNRVGDKFLDWVQSAVPLLTWPEVDFSWGGFTFSYIHIVRYSDLSYIIYSQLSKAELHQHRKRKTWEELSTYIHIVSFTLYFSSFVWSEQLSGVVTIQKYKFIQARFQPTLTCLQSNFEMRWAVLGLTCFIGAAQVTLFKVIYLPGRVGDQSPESDTWHPPACWPSS